MKKLSAIALSVLLAVTAAAPAFAAQGDPVGAQVDTTKKGSVSLTKYDSAKAQRDPDTGAVTRKDGVAADETITVEGAKFTAYQVLSFDGTNYTVTDDFKGVVEVNDLFNTDSQATSFISYGTTSDVEAQITKLQAHSKTLTGTTVTTGADGKAKFENLALGVYLIAETAEPDGSVVTTQAFLVALPQYTDNTWVYDVEAFPKDQSITLDKTFEEKDDSTKQTKADSYEIGDNIPYTITANIPDYGMSSDYPATALMTDNMAANDPEHNGVKKFNDLKLVFTDTMSKGLTLDMSSVKVYIDDVELTNGTRSAEGTLLELASATMDADKKVTLTPVGGTTYNYSALKTTGADDSTVLTVTIPWYVVNGKQGGKIKLTYTAQLNSYALVGSANPNKVTYNFTRNPQQKSGEPTDPITTPDPEVFTYQMDLIKTLNGVKETNSEKYANVKFSMKKGDNALTFFDDNGTWVLWTDAAAPTGKTLVKEITPNVNGEMNVKGLAAGKYTLIETKTADGYTLTTAPINITVSEVKENNKVVGKVSAAVKLNDGTEKPLAGDNDHGHFRIDVNNPKSQFTLPSTGDIGFWIFTIGGGVLMAGAIIFISVLRRKKKS